MKYYRLSDFARIMGVTKATVRNWMKVGLRTRWFDRRLYIPVYEVSGYPIFRKNQIFHGPDATLCLECTRGGKCPARFERDNCLDVDNDEMEVIYEV